MNAFLCVLMIIFTLMITCQGIEFKPCTSRFLKVSCSVTTGFNSFQSRIKKFEAVNNRTGQLWMLADGPGRSVETSFSDEFLDSLRTRLKTFDVLVMEYRMTHENKKRFKLDCSGHGSLRTTSKRQFDACVKHLNRYMPRYNLNFGNFSTEANAYDLIQVINSLKANDTVVVYGLGYGTHVLNAVLRKQPDLVDKVIVDNVILPDYQMYLSDQHIDDLSTYYLSLCDQHSWCSNKMKSLFATSNSSIVQQVFNKQKTKPCLPDYFTISEMKLFLGRCLVSDSLRQLIFPFLFRIYRCDASTDVGFLQNMYTSVYKYVKHDAVFQEDDKGRSSRELFTLIAATEFTNFTAKPPVGTFKNSLSQNSAPYFTLDRSNTIDYSVTYMEPLVNGTLLQLPDGYENSLLVLDSAMDKYSFGAMTYYSSMTVSSDKHIYRCETCSYGMAINDPCATQILIHYIHNNLTNLNCSMPTINDEYFQQFSDLGFNRAFGLPYDRSADIYEGGSSVGFVNRAVMISFVTGILSCIGLCAICLIAGLLTTLITMKTRQVGNFSPLN